jgi:anti-sigma factor RsiW
MRNSDQEEKQTADETAEERMDQEELYALMMEALDGELSDSGLADLEFHLRARPRLAREWEAMRAVDALFRSSPVLQPAVSLRRQTLARLPAPRQRLYAGVLIYLLILASGLIPLAAVAWLAIQLAPALLQPAFWGSLWRAGLQFLGLVQITIAAFFNGASELLRDQPSFLAWFVVLVGIVLLWIGVYNKLVLQSRRVQS